MEEGALCMLLKWREPPMTACLGPWTESWQCWSGWRALWILPGAYILPCCVSPVKAAPHSQVLRKVPEVVQAEGRGYAGDQPGPLSHSHTGFTGWAHLTEVDPDEEVQGEIHLRLEVLPGPPACRLHCTVLEAR